jgi:dynein heavy chain 1
MEGLRYHIQQICKAHFLIPSPDWVEKLLQLYQIQALRHGVMLVGPSGSGKTTAWTVLLEALEKQVLFHHSKI